MQDSEQLAHIAYEAFRTFLGWDRKVLPQRRWDELQEREQQAWEKAAQAVKANVLSEFTKVGEGERP